MKTRIAAAAALAIGLAPLAARAQVGSQDWSTDTVTDGQGQRTLNAISTEERNAFSLAGAALPKAGGTVTGTVTFAAGSGLNTSATSVTFGAVTEGAQTGTSESLSGAITAASLSLTGSVTASYVLAAPAAGGAPTFRQLTTADISGLASGLLAMNPQTAAYTFQNSDCINTLVLDTVSGTAGHSDTIPLGLPQGCRLRLAWFGTDPVSIAGVSAAVTIKSPGNLTLTGVNTSLSAIVTSASNASAETVLVSNGI